MSAKRRKPCKDCPPDSKRPSPHAGPRCATHHREQKARQREAAFARRLWNTYRLKLKDYYKILELQGGACYICQRAKGIRKKLAVDHDHACCPETPTCGKCTRGLLCTVCNKKVLGHLRDDPAALRRGAEYLENPPAKVVLERKAA
jgi:hypothetical protein